MAYVLFCDLCCMPIKEGDNKHILAINSIIQENEKIDGYVNETEALQDLMSQMKRKRKNVRLYEICDKCKKIFEYFINLRLNEIKKIQIQLNEIKEEENGKK